jgi:hypothetical protein
MTTPLTPTDLEFVGEVYAELAMLARKDRAVLSIARLRLYRLWRQR